MHPVQSTVETVVCQKLIMSTHLCDAPAIQNNYEIGIMYCGEPVGDNKRGTVFDQSLNSDLDQHFCFSIHR